MLADKDIIRPDLTVREGLGKGDTTVPSSAVLYPLPVEIVISCGMALPRNLTAVSRSG